MDWQSVELLGYSYYSSQGYRILVSLVRTDGYDFVVEKQGVFTRVNVKKAGIKSKKYPNSWSVSAASGALGRTVPVTVAKTSEIDVLLVYLPHQHRFIELPGDFFSGSKSKSKLIPKDLLTE